MQGFSGPGKGIVIVLFIVTAAVLVPGRHPAFGLDCSARTYGAAQDLSAPENYGVQSYIFVKDGSAYDYAAGGHINASLWEGTNNSTSLSTWVEIGYSRGWNGSNILTWYWADDRPSYGFFEHRITTPSISAGTWHHLKILYSGNNTWTVFIDGSQPNNGGGVSSPNPPDSNSFEAGLESTSECSDLGSSSSPEISDNLQWRARSERCVTRE